MTCELIVIGGSAGSFGVLMELLPGLNEGFNIPIVLVLHRKKTPESMLSDLLSSKTSLIVKEADEKEEIRPGTIYLAPADYHLLIEQDRTFSLDFSEKINFSRPSIDITFRSAADVFGSKLMAILLSGSNNDGTAGMKVVKEKGGLTVVQDPQTSEISYMPQQALNEARPDYVIDNQELADFIKKIVNLNTPNL